MPRNSWQLRTFATGADADGRSALIKYFTLDKLYKLLINNTLLRLFKSVPGPYFAITVKTSRPQIENSVLF
jgi:hypothetical protein